MYCYFSVHFKDIPQNRNLRSPYNLKDRNDTHQDYWKVLVERITLKMSQFKLIIYFTFPIKMWMPVIRWTNCCPGNSCLKSVLMLFNWTRTSDSTSLLGLSDGAFRKRCLTAVCRNMQHTLQFLGVHLQTRTKIQRQSPFWKRLLGFCQPVPINCSNSLSGRSWLGSIVGSGREQ
jgi:hypothetical protein